MKLHKGLNYDDIAYSDHGLFKLEIVGLEGEPGHDYGKDLDEIVRRVNAHAALIEFSTRVAEWRFNLNGDCVAEAQQSARAALALAEKGEGTQ